MHRTKDPHRDRHHDHHHHHHHPHRPRSTARPAEPQGPRHRGTETDSQTTADAALNRIGRNDADGHAILLHITAAGLAAIGIALERTDSALTGADRAPSAEAPQVPLENVWAPPFWAIAGFALGLAGHLATLG